MDIKYFIVSKDAALNYYKLLKIYNIKKKHILKDLKHMRQKQGNNLFNIAEKNNTSIKSLKILNNINSNIILIGKVLRITRY